MTRKQAILRLIIGLGCCASYGGTMNMIATGNVWGHYTPSWILAGFILFDGFYLGVMPVVVCGVLAIALRDLYEKGKVDAADAPISNRDYFLVLVVPAIALPVLHILAHFANLSGE